MKQHIPLMIIPPGICKVFYPLVKRLFARYKFASLKKDLKYIGMNIDIHEYMSCCFINSSFMFLLFSSLFFVLSYRVNEKPIPQAVLIGLGLGAVMFMLFFLLLKRYPSILTGKKSENINKSLIFALKDMLMQVTSGTAIYSAMVNVSLAEHGEISNEFKKAVRAIKSGQTTLQVFENMLLDTKSEYLKKALWQIISTIKSGSNLKNALRSVISELTIDQKTRIKDYAQELNLWALLYMLFAVAIPTIGATMLVILSGFAGFAVTEGTFVFMIIITFFVQVALIGFIKTRRPNVEF